MKVLIFLNISNIESWRRQGPSHIESINLTIPFGPSIIYLLLQSIFRVFSLYFHILLLSSNFQKFSVFIIWTACSFYLWTVHGTMSKMYYHLQLIYSLVILHQHRYFLSSDTILLIINLSN